jgi:hypothetical protein
MSKPDEFEATKQVVAILEPFESSDRERILRWARDKLGMTTSSSTPGSLVSREISPILMSVDQPVDIRSFVQTKNPRTDTQLAAVVAYYHRFVAPESQRKDSIGKEDVLSACRLSGRVRPPRLQQTMVNAFTAGYFDRADRGQYKLNSVGENLVAVALPGAPGNETTASQRRPSAKTRRRRSSKTSKTAARRKHGSRS